MPRRLGNVWYFQFSLDETVFRLHNTRRTRCRSSWISGLTWDSPQTIWVFTIETSVTCDQLSLGFKVTAPSIFRTTRGPARPGWTLRARAAAWTATTRTRGTCTAATGSPGSTAAPPCGTRTRTRWSRCSSPSSGLTRWVFLARTQAVPQIDSALQSS